MGETPNNGEQEAPETESYTIREGTKGILMNGKLMKAGETVELTKEQARAFSDRLEPTSGAAADAAAEAKEQAEKDKEMVAPQATSSVPQDIGAQTPIPHMTPVNPGNAMPLTPDLKPLPPAAAGKADNLSHDFQAIDEAEQPED